MRGDNPLRKEEGKVGQKEKKDARTELTKANKGSDQSRGKEFAPWRGYGRRGRRKRSIKKAQHNEDIVEMGKRPTGDICFRLSGNVGEENREGGVRKESRGGLAPNARKA